MDRSRALRRSRGGLALPLPDTAERGRTLSAAVFLGSAPPAAVSFFRTPRWIPPSPSALDTPLHIEHIIPETVIAALLRIIFYFVDETLGLVKREQKSLELKHRDDRRLPPA
jgi:hypothetical protein